MCSVMNLYSMVIRYSHEHIVLSQRYKGNNSAIHEKKLLREALPPGLGLTKNFAVGSFIDTIGQNT